MKALNKSNIEIPNANKISSIQYKLSSTVKPGNNNSNIISNNNNRYNQNIDYILQGGKSNDIAAVCELKKPQRSISQNIQKDLQYSKYSK